MTQFRRRASDRDPLSNRVRAALTGEDPELVREIEMLERIAMAGVSYVAANGKFPHWPLERWILVIGFIASTTAIIWTGAARWSRVEGDVDALKASVAGLATTLAEDRVAKAKEIRELGVKLDGMAVRPSPPRVAFPRDSQFLGGRK